jgi:hypothetical protein
LTCRDIGVASAQHLSGRRGHEIRTSGRQNGTGFQGNGLGLRPRLQPTKTNELFGSNLTSDALLPKLLSGELSVKPKSN